METRLRLVPIAIVIALVAGACGRADFQVHTTIERSGGLLQEISVTGDGLLAGFLAQGLKSKEELAQDRWDADTRIEDGKLQFQAKRHFEKGEPVVIDIFNQTAQSSASQKSNLGSGLYSKEFVNYTVKDGLFKTRYAFNYTLDPAPTSPASATPKGGADDTYAQMAKALASSMFSFTWKLTVPGKILSTNADSVKGNTVSWLFDMKSLERGRTISLEGEYFKISAVIGVGAAAIVGTLILAGGTLMFMRKRRRA